MRGAPHITNPKQEYLNPKQIQNSNDPMFKTIPTCLPVAVLDFVFWSFNIVSDLDN